MRGELALRWITHPFKQIEYLLQAKSYAYDLSTERYAVKMGWRYGCEFRRVYRFKVPLTLGHIKQDPYLENWNALRAKFQGTTFAMPADIWRVVNRHLSARNPGYDKKLRSVQKRPFRTIILEEHLEERLASNLGILKPFGYDLSCPGFDGHRERGQKPLEEVFDDQAQELYSGVQTRGGSVAGDFEEAAE
jgi:hypothetical protein